tara:strand:- start:446 stop:1141 length:696 start_codon:yes stop_codon:yes gene_type:complete
MKKIKIFVACDTNSLKKVNQIISQTKNKKIDIIPKFGMQFFYSKKGRSFLEKFKKDYWLDLKFCDVPNTASSAIESLKDLKKCKYLTAHAAGGLQMLKVIKKKSKKINKNIKVLGVTILTSLDNSDIKRIGYTKKINKIVLKQANLIKKAGCDGIICSPQEALLVRKKYKKFIIITPGIRLPGDKKNDQSRVLTPYKAIVENKVSSIVMGRSLVSGNIKKNVIRLINHLNL